MLVSRKIFEYFLITMGVSGVIVLFGGILSIVDIPFYTRNHDWSKDSENTSMFYIYSGIFFIFLNIIYFKYIEPKLPEVKDTKPKKIEYSICPNCEESFIYKELNDGKCKYCDDIDTVDIKEYYKKST
jgi:hypothetical protein